MRLLSTEERGKVARELLVPMNGLPQLKTLDSIVEERPGCLTKEQASAVAVLLLGKGFWHNANAPGNWMWRKFGGGACDHELAFVEYGGAWHLRADTADVLSSPLKYAVAAEDELIDENIVDRVERLTQQFADHVAEWAERGFTLESE